MTNAEMNPRFYVKSFFAESVQEAMDQAQREMGADALLLNTKPAPPEARHLGEFEVVFGEYADVLTAQKLTAKKPAPQNPVPDTRPATPQSADEMRDLSAHLAKLAQLVRNRRSDRATPSRDAIPAAGPQPKLLRVADTLVAAGVEPDLARDIAEAVKVRMNKRMVLDISRPGTAAEWDDAALTSETREEIALRCPVQPQLSAVTALVGPPGAGKTSTLVKLAVTQGLALGKAVRLISVDTHRVGGAAQLETYASILGVPFQAVGNPPELAHLIDYAPANTLLLIDTPGYSATLFQELGCDLAELLARRQEIDTHLVLTASMRPEALRQAADLYGAFRPSKLLFTRLDEATSYAAMLCEASRRELPLSFFSTGQSIPEDIVPADAARITDSLVRQLPKAMQAVA